MLLHFIIAGVSKAKDTPTDEVGKPPLIMGWTEALKHDPAQQKLGVEIMRNQVIDGGYAVMIEKDQRALYEYLKSKFETT